MILSVSWDIRDLLQAADRIGIFSLFVLFVRSDLLAFHSRA